MKETISGFKQFILRGNVVDLAVGVVIGAAFSGLVESLVKDILTPVIGAIAKVPDFSGLYFTVHGSQFMYGNFFNHLISFLIVSATIYFFVVTPINKLVMRNKKEEIETLPATPEDVLLLREIRDSLRKQ